MAEIDIDNLVCPKCQGDLGLSDDHLVCNHDRSHRFRIRDGIYSFVGDHEFDEHWEPHGVVPVAEEKINSARNFLDPMLNKTDPQSLVLDVGCGDGVHAMMLTSARESLSYRYIGLDVSFAALASARSRATEGIFLHADAAHIPLKNESVDAVFSYGVIAYTDDPAAAVVEMARVLTPGGMIGIWVYLRPEGLGAWMIKWVRAITALGGPLVTRFIADLIVPLMAFLPVSSGLNLSNASWKQCREVVLVNIAPQNLVFPDRETFAGWISRAGLTIESEDMNPPLTIWARK